MTRRFGHILIGGLFALLSCISLAAYLTPRRPPPLAPTGERWNANLFHVQSIEAAIPVVNQYISKERGTREERIADGIDDFVRDRFVHGVPHEPIQENWAARLAGIAWDNLSVPVTVEGILHHRHAMCSEQSIVFMALLQRYGLEYGSVLFRWPDPDPLNRGHFAVAARVDGVWRYYDSDLEARFPGTDLSRILDGSAVPALYAHNPRTVEKMRYAASHGGIRLAHVNQNPAPRGALFEKATRWFSKWGWLSMGAIWAAYALVGKVV